MKKRDEIFPANGMKMRWERKSPLASLVFTNAEGDTVTVKLPVDALRTLAVDIVAKLPSIESPSSGKH